MSENIVEEAPKRKRGRPKKETSDVKTVKAKTEKKTRRPRKADWQTLRGKIDETEIVDYSLKDDYSEIAAINHNKFGIGIILKVLDEKKIQVVFEEATKVLAQNWV